MRVFLLFLVLSGFCSAVFGVEATEVREWKAVSGHEVKAKALSIKGGKVVFERENGKTLKVDMAKLVDADQAFLREHFELPEPGAVTKPDMGEEASDLAHPLGKTTAELACGDGFHYYLYLPKSLRRDQKYPVLFVMSPGGGNAGVANRYIEGAERNRWILAVSKESKNGFAGSREAILAMMDEVTSELPIDKKRMYVSGFSGGSRMAYATAQKETKIAGVIACGAGGMIGSRKQWVYGLCGSNCFNRTDMAHAFKKVSSKGSVLRYFEGMHVWANAELCDDAMTHLNGLFLKKNEGKYGEEYADYVYRVGELIQENETKNPKRAYMWADYLKKHGMEHSGAEKIGQALGGDEDNVLFVKGLYGIRDFVEKTFGKVSVSQWKSDPGVARACRREAKKYAGHYWEKVLLKMSEDAQKF